MPAEKCLRKARAGDVISVHYTGALLDGTVFDSSLRPGRQPLQFALGLGQVIEGWDRGLIGMCIGEKRKLTIPSHLGYGSAGAGNAIPPDATLVFTTELIGIQGYEAPAAEEEEVEVEAPKAEKEAEDLPEPETKVEDEPEQESATEPVKAKPTPESVKEDAAAPAAEEAEAEATGVDNDEL